MHPRWHPSQALSWSGPSKLPPEWQAALLLQRATSTLHAALQQQEHIPQRFLADPLCSRFRGGSSIYKVPVRSDSPLHIRHSSVQQICLMRWGTCTINAPSILSW